MIILTMEGSHSGLVRPPAKRLLREIGVMGSNPIPSAIKQLFMPLSEKGHFFQNVFEGSAQCLSMRHLVIDLKGAKPL